MTIVIDFVKEISAIFQNCRFQISYSDVVLKQSPWRPEIFDRQTLNAKLINNFIQRSNTIPKTR